MRYDAEKIGWHNMKNVLSYVRYLTEAMSPNFVIKGGSVEPEKKDYLKKLDGSIFRAHRGRSYSTLDMYGIKQYHVDFSYVDFRGIDISKSMFRSCSFDGCDMTDAIATETRFVDCSFIDAKGMESIQNARFENCVF